MLFINLELDLDDNVEKREESSKRDTSLNSLMLVGMTVGCRKWIWAVWR